MALVPVLAAVQGGGYISLIALAPAVLLLLGWARLLTWVDLSSTLGS